MPVTCMHCGWKGFHVSGPIQGAVCPQCTHGRIVRRDLSLEKRSTFLRLGKFDSARDSALYDLAIVSDYSGNSEAPMGWFAAVSIDAEGLRDLVQSQSAWEFAGLREMVEARESFDTLLGNFIVSGDDRGFVYVETFDTAEALEAEFVKRDDAYSAWLNTEEGEGYY